MHQYKIGRLNGRFVVSWWADGKRRRYRLGADSLSDAQREAVDVIRSASERPAVETVETLWTAYVADHAGRPMADAMHHEWKAIGPHFGAYRPDQITLAMCRAYTAARRSAGRQDGTIWTELGRLRIVLKWAERTRLIDHAPAIERPPQPKPRERHLTREEAVRLVHAAQGHVRLAILLMLTTACRIGAALDLTWDRVNLERRVIVLALPDATTRKGRATVPINDDLMAALSEARRVALSPYVIEWAGDRVGSIKTGFRRAVAAAGLENVSPHVLRHSAAVWMAEDGVPMSEISQYLGHSNEAITARVYARYSPEHLQKAAAALNFMAVRQVR